MWGKGTVRWVGDSRRVPDGPGSTQSSISMLSVTCVIPLIWDDSNRQLPVPLSPPAAHSALQGGGSRPGSHKNLKMLWESFGPRGMALGSHAIRSGTWWELH